jgi:hypothetical protein
VLAPTPIRVETFWLVKETCRVPKRGGIYYQLPRGKVLSSFHYDIDEMKALGVNLELVGDKHSLPKAIVISQA